MDSVNLTNFTQPTFLFLFLPIVLLIYLILPRIAKNSVLLAASILFYSFGEGFYTSVVIGSIIYNYFAGHVIDSASNKRWRTLLLTGAIAVNLTTLIVFKYAAFIVGNLNALAAPFHLHMRVPHLHLPIGISFFTFHALSYVIDVYRREVRPMRRFDSFALYIALFPQLIAGPIIRYKTICNQFSIGDAGGPGRKHTWENFAEGVRRFVIGLGKKMLIANIVAEAADGIFSAPNGQVTPGAAWLGIICYSLQIYFDFSGYSDMAIGLGRMFGFTFPENFNYPYISSSMTEFWRRWHISLSSWFRDYLYIPLGGNRVSSARTYLNLFIVFFLCGFWHGASWTFLFWGMFHGGFLIVERLGLGKFLERRNILLRHGYTLAAIMVGWVFFRAESLPDAWQYLARMAFLTTPGISDVQAGIFLNHRLLLAIFAGLLGSLPWLPWARSAWQNVLARTTGAPVIVGVLAGRLVELGGLAVIFFISCGYSAAGTYNPFIYFRF